MRISNGNFLDEDGNEVNLVELLRTGKATPVVNNSDGHHMSAHSGWFTDENGTPVNIVALIDAAIDEDDSSDEPAIGGISINGGSVVTPDENGIINLTISGDGSTVIDSELSTSSTNPVQNKVVAGEIEDLNEAVNAVNGSLDTLYEDGADKGYLRLRDLFDSSADNSTTGYYSRTNEFVESSRLWSTDFVPVVAGQTVTIATVNTFCLAYDANKEFVRALNTEGASSNRSRYTIPQGVEYCRFNCAVSSFPSYNGFYIHDGTYEYVRAEDIVSDYVSTQIAAAVNALEDSIESRLADVGELAGNNALPLNAVELIVDILSAAVYDSSNPQVVNIEALKTLLLDREYASKSGGMLTIRKTQVNPIKTGTTLKFVKRG